MIFSHSNNIHKDSRSTASRPRGRRFNFKSEVLISTFATASNPVWRVIMACSPCVFSPVKICGRELFAKGRTFGTVKDLEIRVLWGAQAIGYEVVKRAGDCVTFHPQGGRSVLMDMYTIYCNILVIQDFRYLVNNHSFHFCSIMCTC